MLVRTRHLVPRLASWQQPKRSSSLTSNNDKDKPNNIKGHQNPEINRRNSLSTSSLTAVASDSKRKESKDTTNSGGTISGSMRPVSLAYKSFSMKPREGDKKKSPLVVHHSLLGSRANWKRVAKEINHITRRTVITVDARNHGESPHSNDMSYSLLAKDLTNLICKEEQLDKVSLMGHSMGGRVGMIVALTQPQLVDKIVCVDATPKNTQVSLDRWQTLRDACWILKALEPALRTEFGISRRLMADKAIQKVMPDSRDRSLFLTNLLTNINNNGSSNQTSSVEEMAEKALTAPLWRLNIDAIIANPTMTMTFPRFPEGTTFDGKALFIAGENSKFLKKEDQEEITALFPRAKFAWVKGCGHWIQTDKHEEFMRHVVPFLESSSS